MWGKTYRLMICSLTALVLILITSAAGLTVAEQDRAYAAVNPQPDEKNNVQPEDSSDKTPGSDSLPTGSSQSDSLPAAGTQSDSLPTSSPDSDSTESGSSETSSPETSSLKPENKSGSVASPAGNNLNTSVKKDSSHGLSLREIISSRGLTVSQLHIRLFVDKSDKLLTVYNGDTPLKSYHVELGDSGPGDKYVSGNHKTPEGSFYITQKLVLDPPDEYLGTRWMRLSYPNIEDAQRGLDSGLIDSAAYNAIVNAINNGETPPQDTALGGGVGVHGGSTPGLGINWTYGCVGLSNKDVQDFYDFVKVGTRVTIQQ